MRVYDLYGKDAGNWLPECCVDANFRIGIEYEVEAVVGWDEKGCLQHSIKAITDGSLRNHGKEFITRPKLKDEAMVTFDAMFHSRQLTQGVQGPPILSLGDEPFSPRTSTHVHMNVAMLDETQVLTLLYTYVALEPYFFNLAKPERRHNIHCLPLSDTHLSKYYAKQNLHQLIDQWSKYTALNIRPIPTQGSIEFRHLHGTNDKVLFLKWVETIECLYKYAVSHTLVDFYNFWLNKGTAKALEQVVFGQQSNLTEDEYFVSVMDAKSAFL